MPHSGRHFLRFLCDLIPKRTIWGALGAQLASKWRPKSPKWRQKALKKHPGRSLFEGPRNDLLPRSLSERSLAQLWSIWDGFCMNFEWFLHNCWCISVMFAIKFIDCQHRLTRSELTAKHQEHTDICRKIQESNANKKHRHQNSDRWFAICRVQSAAPTA